MILRLLLFAGLLIVPGLAWAENAKVRSGEHAGFSRLVVTLAEPAAWKFGRSEDGYELRLDRAGVIFDLAQVFTRIPKTRIGAVASMGESRLTVTANCACHAETFEFRPGILVIDLKDGAPPEGSRFETVLDTRQTEEPPETPAYEWVAAGTKVEDKRPVAMLPATALRDSLLRELSLGAARGVIDMQLAEVPGPETAGQMTGQIRVGTEISFEPHQGGATDPVTLQSGICIDEMALAIQDWASPADPAAVLSRAREGLLEEFDKPDPDAVEKAARRYIFLGFGREARQIVAQLAPEIPSAPLLMSLGILVDGEADPVTAFAGMENCDTAAALWSVLARSHLRPSERINASAIVRAFSALPPGLRRTLVLPLGERLLEQGDTESARRVRDAAGRVSQDGATGAALMTAELLVHEGDSIAAEEKLAAIAGGRGSLEPEALIAQVELAAAQRSAVPPETISDLAILAQQHRGLDIEPKLRRALVLAEALSGDFGAAMKDVERAPESRMEVWSLLAEIGPDTAVLDFAIFGQSEVRPQVPRDTGVRFAERLAKLGFGDEAALWLSAVAPDPGSRAEQERLLFARIALANRDALSTVRHLAGIPGADAASLRAEAQMQLGDFSAAVLSLKEVEDVEGVARAERLSQHWEGVATQDAGVWQRAASFAPGEGPALPEGEAVTLSAAIQVVSESGAAREALSALLSRP